MKFYVIPFQNKNNSHNSYPKHYSTLVEMYMFSTYCTSYSTFLLEFEILPRETGVIFFRHLGLYFRYLTEIKQLMKLSFLSISNQGTNMPDNCIHLR
jgi:hypothetical protein